MTIRMIKFYAGVILSGATLTSFTPDDLLSDAGQKKGHKARVLDNGVEISNAEQTCFVPFNNVTYVQYVNAAPVVSKPASKAK